MRPSGVKRTRRICVDSSRPRVGPPALRQPLTKPHSHSDHAGGPRTYVGRAFFRDPAFWGGVKGNLLQLHVFPQVCRLHVDCARTKCVGGWCLSRRFGDVRILETVDWCTHCGRWECWNVLSLWRGAFSLTLRALSRCRCDNACGEIKCEPSAC